jgi:HEAT repeat protein
MKGDFEPVAARPLQEVLNEAFDVSKPLRISALSRLSDLDRADVRFLRGVWGGAPVERRREIVSFLAHLAEDNLDMDFGRVYISILDDPDPQVRALAASGLAIYEDSAAIAPLVNLLIKDVSDSARLAAARSLGKFVLMGELDEMPSGEVDRARQALLSVIDDKKQSPELRRRALESISSWTNDGVTERIANAYRNSEPGFKGSALYSMGMNCDARWLPALLAELKNEDPHLRYEAAHAIGEVGEQKAVPHLLPLLRDEDIEVRLAAIWALGQVGGRAAKQALRSLRTAQDVRIREAVEQALDEISLGDDVMSI